jgi:hypothetical protein
MQRATLQFVFACLSMMLDVAVTQQLLYPAQVLELNGENGGNRTLDPGIMTQVDFARFLRGSDAEYRCIKLRLEHG